jgi:metallo-beta-lactamase family protein
VGTLGRSIENGVTKVRIMGEDIHIKAKVEMISGYSGHKDSDHLVEFVEDTAKTVKKVFLLMGEPKASMFLAQRLKDNLNVDAYIPTHGEQITLDL